MKKILFIETGTSGGGSFKSLYLFLKNIDRKKYIPFVLYFSYGSHIQEMEEIGVETLVFTHSSFSKKTNGIFLRFALKALRIILAKLDKDKLIYTYVSYFKIIHKIKAIITKHAIDLIYLNDQISRDYFGVLLKKNCMVKIISHLRSMRSGKFNQYQAEAANYYIDQFIANSIACREHWLNLGLDATKISVIYNAVENTPVYQQDLRKEYGLPEITGYILGCVANFLPGKGHEILINAFTKLSRIATNSVLILAGEGELKQKCMRLAEENGIEDKVIFAGYIKNPLNIIAGMDLLVVPSTTEAFGRVVLEGFLAKTPVIASNVGGLREILKHMENGLLFEPTNHLQLADLMLKVLSDESLKVKLVEGGIASLKHSYGIDTYTEKVAETIDKLLNS